jgi:hypothetical protein
MEGRRGNKSPVNSKVMLVEPTTQQSPVNSKVMLVEPTAQYLHTLHYHCDLE